MLYILTAASATLLTLAGLGALAELIPDRLWRRWIEQVQGQNMPIKRKEKGSI